MATKKRSKKSESTLVTSKSVITRGEFDKFINSMSLPLFGLAEAGKIAFADPWSEERAAAHVCMTSGEKISELDDTLSNRFVSAHSLSGRAYISDLPETAEIEITRSDVDEYEEALGPALSLFNLMRSQSIEGMSGSICHAGELIVQVASEGRALLRSRVPAVEEDAEGGAA
jgi:hypothetical protein